MADVILRIPEEWKSEIEVLWKQLRVIEGAPHELDLRNPNSVAPFDGAALTEWLVPISQMSVPLLTCILGYLVARKGEFEIQDGKLVRKFKNMSPSQIREVMDILDKHKKT